MGLTTKIKKEKEKLWVSRRRSFVKKKQYFDEKRIKQITFSAEICSKKNFSKF